MDGPFNPHNLSFRTPELARRRPDRALLNLKIDAGGVHARRIIERELHRAAVGRVAVSLIAEG